MPPPRAIAFIGRSSARRLTQGNEFRHEDIIGDRTHCGVCHRRRQRVGGYEQGLQVGSPPLVRTGPNSR
jgi:hypothetical protein